MKTKESLVDGIDPAVRNRRNGFSHAMRHFFGDALAARRKRRAMRRTAEDLNQLSPHLQRDIDWPALPDHERK